MTFNVNIFLLKVLITIINYYIIRRNIGVVNNIIIIFDLFFLSFYRKIIVYNFIHIFTKSHAFHCYFHREKTVFENFLSERVLFYAVNKKIFIDVLKMINNS